MMATYHQKQKDFYNISRKKLELYEQKDQEKNAGKEIAANVIKAIKEKLKK